MDKKLIVLVGLPCTFKTSVSKAISKNYNIPLIKYSTTRPMRDESEKEDYYFLDKISESEKDNFIWYKTYNVYGGEQWIYLLSPTNIDSAFKGSDTDTAILSAGVDSVENIKNYCHARGITVVVITLQRHLSSILYTAYNRGDSLHEIRRRMLADKPLIDAIECRWHQPLISSTMTERGSFIELSTDIEKGFKRAYSYVEWVVEHYYNKR